MKKTDPFESSGPAEQPLAGKTILVTRAQSQSAAITSVFEAWGARVIHCPTIEVAPPNSWDSLDASIERITEYDWIVFTSSNGVDFFFRRLQEKRVDGCAALRGRVICAIGPATARALETVGIPAEIIASDSRAEGVLKAIVDHQGGEQLVKGLRFLIPRAQIAREFLPDALRNLGANVDAVDTYQTVKPDIDGENITRLFNENSIDAITFTSPSTVKNFAALVGLQDLSELLANTLVACIGPVTAETAASHGLKNVVVPDEYTGDALVETVVKATSRQ